jgi:hypothetical protein
MHSPLPTVEMADADADAAEAALSDFLSATRTRFAAHIRRRGVSPDDGSHAFVVTLSEPTARRPVPEHAVRMNVRVSRDVSSASPAAAAPRIFYCLESQCAWKEASVPQTGDAAAGWSDAAVDRIVRSKASLSSLVDLSDSFGATRLVPRDVLDSLPPEDSGESKDEAPVDSSAAPSHAASARGRATDEQRESLELERQLVALFGECDGDGTGNLPAATFAAVLRRADLGLTDEQLSLVIGQADENDDGVVDYREFVTAAVQLIHALRAKMEAAQRIKSRAKRAHEMALEKCYAPEVVAAAKAAEALIDAEDCSGSRVVHRKTLRRLLVSPKYVRKWAPALRHHADRRLLSQDRIVARGGEHDHGVRHRG